MARSEHVELRLGHTVTGLARGDDDVTVTVRDEAGASYLIRARYVLGCDGASGVTRDQIGAEYVGRSDPRPNFNMVIRAPSLDTHLGPAVQYWVLDAPVPGVIGRLDLSGTWFAITPGIDPAYGNEHSAELITGLVGAPVEHELLASDPWTARMLIADKFSDGRVFLVGESAHVNPPWGGHGFNTSVGDAVNIAWKIAAVLQGWAPERLLASYDPERRDVVEKTVASAASHLSKMAGDLPRDEASIQQAKGPEFYSLGLGAATRPLPSCWAAPATGGSRSPSSTHRRPTPGARSSCWSDPTSTLPGGPTTRPTLTLRRPSAIPSR